LSGSNGVDTLDESNLILVNKSYILQDFNEKEADIVYHLRTKDKNVIFYILLELQSTVDYLIPFRLLLYMVEIWREVYNNTPRAERERKGFRLPPVIPAVLFNGENPWTVGFNFKEMLADYQEFEPHLLDFRYLLFDVNRYHEEELIRAANVIASVFLLDQKMVPRELVHRLHKLINVLKELSPDEFRQLTTWMKNVIKPKTPATLQVQVDGILDATNPWEVEQMITNLEITLDKMWQEAILQGKSEGKLEGKLEGLSYPHYSRGSRTLKVVPRPTVLSTSIRPPWARAIQSQMARPRPKPPAARERALSTR